ncbi:phytol kinase [Bertholletia excelsa]
MKLAVVAMSVVASPAAAKITIISSNHLPISAFLRRNISHSLSSTTSSTLLLSRRPRRAWAFDDYGDVRRMPLTFRSRTTALSLAVGTHGGSALMQDAGATLVVMAGAYALVLAFDFLTQRNLIEQSLSRKLVHILSGLLFMGFWPIFSTSMGARYFAALVPLVNCVKLITHGLSLATDERLIKSVTREGKREELLRGPLYYVIILIFCVLVFWRESPVGVISLAMMCGGDGVADIMGRRFGSIKIPYNSQKSWAGSISMFAVGFFTSIGMLYYFSALGYFQLDLAQTVQRVALVAFVATVVESLPITWVVDDNISVPLASMVTAILSFGL